MTFPILFGQLEEWQMWVGGGVLLALMLFVGFILLVARCVQALPEQPRAGDLRQGRRRRRRASASTAAPRSSGR